MAGAQQRDRARATVGLAAAVLLPMPAVLVLPDLFGPLFGDLQRWVTKLSQPSGAVGGWAWWGGSGAGRLVQRRDA